jgi:hypothetical protein
MALTFRRFIGGIQLLGTANTAVSLAGEVEFLTTVNKLNLHNGTTASPIVTEAHTATLTNKTLSGNTATNLVNGSGTFNFNSTGTLTAPNATDTLVGRATTDTLTNKTLSGNIATNLISGAGTFTLNTSGTVTAPNATDTLVGRATTDTLTNKTIDAGSNTITNLADGNISASAAIAFSKLAALTSAHILVGSGSNVATDVAVTGDISLTNAGVTAYSGTVPINKGGTGQITKTLGFNALSPLTTKGDTVVFDGTNNVRQGIGTDGQVLVSDSTQTNGLKWTTLQQGAKNYVTYNNFENNATTGWSLAHTTLSSLVPNQASGSWTSASGSLAFTSVSSGALAGTYSGQLAWTGTTSVPGDMLVSQAYTIDIEDQAKVMTFKFYYSPTVGSSLLNFSGTSSNTYQVYIYDVANSAWIQPAGAYGMTQGSGVGYVTGTFQTPSNMTSFRLALVCVNASSSGSHTILVDDFVVGPQTAPYGPVVTDLQSYTMTITSTGGGTPAVGTNTLNQAVWSRVGDRLYFRYDLLQTAAGTAGTAGTYLFALPSGLNIDTTKLSLSGNRVVGSGYAYNGTTEYVAEPIGWDATHFAILIYPTATTTTLLGTTNVSLGNTTARISVQGYLPISGWSSNVQSSSDTDTRVCAAFYQMSSGVSTPNTNSFNFDTKVFDTHGAVTTGTGWIYTIPVSGIYEIGYSLAVPAASCYAKLYKNGAFYLDFGLVPTNQTIGHSVTVSVVAGDTLAIRPSTTVTPGSGLSDVPTSNWIFVKRLSGPSVVAATESVYAKANTSATSVTGSATTTLVFTVKEFDTHGAYNTATGIFTCPTSGTYEVSAFFASSAATVTSAIANYNTLRINKGGVQVCQIGVVINQTTSSYARVVSGTGMVKCVAGDQLSVAINNPDSTYTGANTDTQTWASFKRLGN